MAEYIKREAVIDLITRRYENPEICTQEINSQPLTPWKWSGVGIASTGTQIRGASMWMMMITFTAPEENGKKVLTDETCICQL